MTMRDNIVTALKAHTFNVHGSTIKLRFGTMDAPVQVVRGRPYTAGQRKLPVTAEAAVIAALIAEVQHDLDQFYAHSQVYKFYGLYIYQAPVPGKPSIFSYAKATSK